MGGECFAVKRRRFSFPKIPFSARISKRGFLPASAFLSRRARASPLVLRVPVLNRAGGGLRGVRQAVKMRQGGGGVGFPVLPNHKKTDRLLRSA